MKRLTVGSTVSRGAEVHEPVHRYLSPIYQADKNQGRTKRRGLRERTYLFMFLVGILSCPLYAGTVFTVTNTNDSGAGSLRQALADAIATAGTDTIDFNIAGTGPHTIRPASALPDISEPVIIRGYTQPGAAAATENTPATILIELDGTNAGDDTHGLVMDADGSAVQGLVINRFGRAGIVVLGDNCTVQGCYIGTDPSGTQALGNGFRSTDQFPYDGIWINDASNTLVGGTSAASRNVLSGNAGAGVYINGPAGTMNRVRGNYIGTDATGSAALGNQSTGVDIVDSRKNLVGGAVPGARNIISANGLNGVGVSANSYASADSNIVRGNYIGLDVSGTRALGNGANGVGTFNASFTLVGGKAPGAGNVVSANQGVGIRFAREPGGLPADGNIVRGNFVGTDATGMEDLGNQLDGVALRNSSNNVIGGTSEAARNVIADNGFAGIFIRGVEATNNTVQGNYIGLDAAGASLLPNDDSGVDILEAENNLIGGTEEGAGNKIAGNGKAGVAVRLSSNSASRSVQPGSNLERPSEVARPSQSGLNQAGLTGRRHKTQPFSAHALSAGTDRGPADMGELNKASQNAAPGQGNAIRRNSMFENVAIGIELEGVPRGNDPDDPDGGANKGQNYPTLEMASGSGSALSIDYLVSSASANAAYPIEVEFFLASADGEGKVYLGSDTYTTPNSSKNVAITPPVTLADGDPIVATATDADGNTSEFSDPLAITGIVSVEDESAAIPASFDLEQNYPNPFNPVTTIRFSLAKSTSVKLEIIDRTGRVVATLVDETLPAGAYTTSFDAGDQASGVYFYRLSTDRGFSQTKRLVLMK